MGEIWTYMIVGSLALYVGAGLGYWTALKDKEKKK